MEIGATETMDDTPAQVLVAKATGVAGGGTFVLGLSVNEFVAFAGLGIAILGFCYQVWLGQQKLKLHKIQTRLKAVQSEVHEVHDCLTDADLPPLDEQEGGR